MNIYIVPLLALALVATLGYFRGKKKNAWMSGWISREAEEAFKPLDTEYVNIGGTIGYNFKYKMKGMFREANGTITMLPRQSVLYFPVSLLTTKYDRYYLNLKADGKLAGEGHIVSEKYIKSARSLISGYESFKQTEYSSEGITFYLLSRTQSVEKLLVNFIEKTESIKHLRHFCCFPDNKNFFIFIKPVKGELFKFLKSAAAALDIFYIKGKKNDN
ncbi:MAG: hypothetical protein RBT69_08080 [Spirochaetia bacterium]|jgi:hypothetical protein|nr:hypothetical protein [Spirochaetia bacterium]